MDRGSQLDEDDEDDEDDKEDEEDEEERRRGGGGGGRGRRQEEAGGGRRRQEEATDIKSNNPHLAGGEQSHERISEQDSGLKPKKQLQMKSSTKLRSEDVKLCRYDSVFFPRKSLQTLRWNLMQQACRF